LGAFKDPRCLGSSDCSANHILHIRHIDSVARGAIAIDLDLKNRETTRLLNFDIGSTRNLSEAPQTGWSLTSPISECVLKDDV
jgi:hypothetical protein